MFTHDRIKLSLIYDAQCLKDDLKALESIDWINHFVTDNYQGDWSVIPLTAQKGRTHPILMASAVPGDNDFIPTPYLEECPYFQNLLASFKTKLFSVRLMRLTAGSEIKEHRDYDLDDGEIRLHVPIITNEDVHFYLNQKEVVMKEGECWYLRLSEPHRVVNASNEDRVHLVMDMELNDWLKEAIAEAERV